MHHVKVDSVPSSPIPDWPMEAGPNHDTTVTLHRKHTATRCLNPKVSVSAGEATIVVPSSSRDHGTARSLASQESCKRGSRGGSAGPVAFLPFPADSRQIKAAVRSYTLGRYG